MTDAKERFYCQFCQCETNHDLLYDESVSIDLEDGSRIWKVYDMIRCLGCDGIAFHYSECHTSTSDPKSQLLSAKSEYYPRRKLTRKPIEGIKELPESVARIYAEVLASLDVELPILSAAGIRSLIESMCREKSYNWKGLYDGIEGLAVDGILSMTQVEFLHACRFMGNSAVHELSPPSKDQLLSALDIVEITMNSIYILPAKAKATERKEKGGT